jgi:hypothetical protein
MPTPSMDDMVFALACSCCVHAMTALPPAPDPWDDAFRRHERKVYLSVLALHLGN